MICFKAKEFVGGIGTDVLDIFPNAQTKPVKTRCRRIQYYNKNIDIHCMCGRQPHCIHCSAPV